MRRPSDSVLSKIFGITGIGAIMRATGGFTVMTNGFSSQTVGLVRQFGFVFVA